MGYGVCVCVCVSVYPSVYREWRQSVEVGGSTGRLERAGLAAHAASAAPASAATAAGVRGEHGADVLRLLAASRRLHRATPPHARTHARTQPLKK